MTERRLRVHDPPVMMMLEIDGARSEGGGQILRSSISLSLATGTAVRVANIRGGRARPGLMRQHLTAVLAAAEIGEAQVDGAEVGSRSLTFQPRAVRSGEYRFSVGTAGSATLVLQTIFPALALAKGRSTVTIEGGTHNPHAPPFDFLARTFLPLVARLGPRATATLERAGFYPAGGGRIRVEIEPAPRFEALVLLERGAIRARRATAVLSRLARSIGDRELAAIGERLGWAGAELHLESVAHPVGPGNVLCAEIESEHVTEVFTGFGERGVPAETVAAGVASEVADYLAADVPVGKHLADQLLLPMALGGGGSFRTVEPTAHARAQVELLGTFLGSEIRVRQTDRAWEIEVPPVRA